nr:hypothetical protein [Streptomyces sp. SID5785]
MESQKVTPVTGAGFDPAYVPGLTSPVTEAAAEDAVTGSDEPSEEVTQDAVPEDAAPEEAPAEQDEDTTDAEDEAEDAGSEPVRGADSDGPVLEAKDRRGSISVDASGVRFTLDDQEAEFGWDEISAVEVGTSRKRLLVTVHTPNSRWYPNDVEAPDKARLQEWTETLDKALDAYFED